MNRHPRKKMEAHLAWVRTLPDIVRGDGPTEAAHIRFAAPELGKRYTGMAEKPDDMWVVPMAASAHRDQHATNERAFWASHGINPLYVAAFLWIHSGDYELGSLIIRNARSIAPWSIAA